MSTEVKISIEDNIMIKANKYALDKKRSLSDIIEEYLKEITSDQTSINKNELSPIVKSLKGSFTEPKNFDYEKELSNTLIKKYL